jgi:MFS family permease
MRGIRRSGLWAQRGFALLWTGQTVSRLGSEVTLVAMPLTAIAVLDASPTQMGMLMAAGYLPAALFGFVAGAWVDRVRRRPLLIVGQVTLGLTTLTVPVAGVAGVLSFDQLLVLQTINGALTVLTTSAGVAFLPRLVGATYLAEANARLATSSSIARVSGPAVAGLLVQVFSAPIAMLADALSFLFSASCVAFIRIAEPVVRRRRARSIFADIKEGLYLVLQHRLLRPMVLALGTYNLFAAMFTAVQTLFMVRELELSPAMIGAVYACGGIGGIVGGFVAERLMRRIGTGRSLVVGALLLAAMHLVVPIVGGGAMFAAVVLASSSVLAQLGAAVVLVTQNTLMQQLVPVHVLGRVAATRQVVVLALVPIGFALGGAIGDQLGLRAALGIGAVGTLLVGVVLLPSPLWTSETCEQQTLAAPEAHERDGGDLSAYQPLLKFSVLNGKAKA